MSDSANDSPAFRRRPDPAHAPFDGPAFAGDAADPRALLMEPIASGPRSRGASRSPRSRGAAFRLTVLLMILAFLGGVFVVRLPAVSAALGAPPLGPVEDVFNTIRYGFVEEKKPDELVRGAIDGLIESLDDPYAEYIPPDDRDNFEKEMTGQYCGIGCEVESRDGWLTVVSPMEDSPALLAGVLPNDRIIKIGDESTYNKPVDDCVKLLVGKEGEPVHFTVLRDGQEIPFDIKRAQITSRSVRGVDRLRESGPDDLHGGWNWLIDPEKRIAYFRLSQFTPTAAEELSDAISAAMNEAAAPTADGKPGGELQGLILDLRENPGGAFEAAIEIADLFIDSGTIVSVKGRNNALGMNQTIAATAHDPASGYVQVSPDLPLLVMVDGLSASASEIVSGALQDHHRATILGSRTFGKGLVQTVLPLSHQTNAQVKLTTARYYLPSGRLIQREDESTQWGVDPTPGFFVPETDDQLADRLTRRRDLDVLRRRADPGADRPAEQWSDPDWVEHEAKDLPLAAALRVMRTRVSTGKFEPISDVQAQHGQIAIKELRDLERAERLTAMELARLDKRARALEKAAETGEKPHQVADLWSDDLKLNDGTVEVRDKDGKLVATLRITGRDLERWLANADVEPIKPAAQAPTPSPDPTAPKDPDHAPTDPSASAPPNPEPQTPPSEPQP